MAAVEVTAYGRFWMTAEDIERPSYGIAKSPD
jgi:hypothetical protein